MPQCLPNVVATLSHHWCVSWDVIGGVWTNSSLTWACLVVNINAITNIWREIRHTQVCQISYLWLTSSRSAFPAGKLTFQCWNNINMTLFLKQCQEFNLISTIRTVGWIGFYNFNSVDHQVPTEIRRKPQIILNNPKMWNLSGKFPDSMEENFLGRLLFVHFTCCSMHTWTNMQNIPLVFSIFMLFSHSHSTFANLCGTQSTPGLC